MKIPPLVTSFAAILGLAAVSMAQLPPLNSGGSPVSPMAGKVSMSAPGPVTPQNSGAPLFGQSWPHIGPDPAPRVGPPSRCPPGYGEDTSRPRTPHLVVCLATQPNFAMSFSGTPNSTSTANASYPGHTASGQPVSSLPPSLENSTAAVNQCIGRPAGSYACGRGGTECCGPTQDNSCFAGAYACNASMSGSGPKKACCISR
jgi:hypothetical protein